MNILCILNVYKPLFKRHLRPTCKCLHALPSQGTQEYFGRYSVKKYSRQHSMIFSVLILTCYRCHNNCGLPVWGQQEQGQLQKISREGKIEALSTRWLTTIENIKILNFLWHFYVVLSNFNDEIHRRQQMGKYHKPLGRPMFSFTFYMLMCILSWGRFGPCW